MNIFMLSRCPIASAKAMTDRHISKMVVETAQLLSTAHHILDGDDAIGGIYKSTHKNHPSAVWARETTGNYDWLYSHFVALCREYTHRYGKTHLTQTKMERILYYHPKNLKGGSQTPIPQCMPDIYKQADAVQAYRAYYQGPEKAHIMKWAKARPAPGWFDTAEIDYSMGIVI